MPHAERFAGKAALQKSCSVKSEDAEKPDLHLTGSQIHLACRPKPSSGGSSRSPSCCGHRSKRPMSALPSFGHQRIGVTCIDGRKRPQSADIPYSPGNQSASSSGTSECDLYNETARSYNKKQYNSAWRRNKLAAKFPLMGENSNSTNTAERTKTRDDNVVGLDEGFGATYTLPSSQLLESLTSHPLGRTWTEAELKECCQELGIENSYVARFELESLGSDDICQSEKSLGEQIKTMAQDKKTCGLPLEPGLEAKPPLPQSMKPITRDLENTVSRDNENYLDNSNNDILFEKITSQCRIRTPNKPLSFLEKIMQMSDDSNRNVDNANADYSLLQQYLPSHVRSSANFAFQCSVLEDSDDVTNVLNVGYLNKTYQNAVTGVEKDTDNLMDLKFQRWFSESDLALPSSRLSDAERQTDMLFETLATEQFNIDPSNSCVTETDANNVSKEKKQELHLERLVEEDVEECEKGITVQRCSNAKTEAEKLSAEQSNRSHRSVKKKSGGHSQPSTEVSNNAGKSEGSTSTSEPQTVLNQPDETQGILYSQMSGLSSATNNEFVTSWLNTQPERPEQNEEPLRIQEIILSPKESAQNNMTSEPGTLNTAESKNIETYQHAVVSEDRTSDRVPVTSNGAALDACGNSAYDDIVTILKVLEEEDFHPAVKVDKPKQTTVTEKLPSSDRVNSVQKDLAADGKLRDILTYLDEIEQCCDATLESARSQIQIVNETTRNSELKLSAMPRLDDLLKMTTVDLAHEVLTLRLQMEEKNSSIGMLQETLKEQRDLAIRNMKNAERDMKTRFSEQKKEYETAVTRHQKFIDQLMADKKCLSDKCEGLVVEMKKVEDRYQTTLKTVEERHKIELQKAKEMHAAAEKLRRERWIDTKTQKIKEMTVKGLEPELQRMNTRHQQELADLRMLHKQELDEIELRAARKTAQQMEQLRDQLIAEKEEALLKEKELLRHRIEKQAEIEEKNYQAQRQKLLADVRWEKQRLSDEEKRLKEDLEEAKQHLMKENVRIIEKLRQEHRDELETMNKKHQNELKSVKDSLEAEKETWMHSYKKEQTVLMCQRETEIRDQYKKDRDKEIELVIGRLESEASQSRAEMEQVMENRLRRLKEKFEAEIKDLEASELALKNKHNETRQKLVEKEDEIIHLKATTRQLEKELEEAKKITDRLSAERAEMREVVRREFEAQLSGAEQENIRLREDMAELKTRHEMEMTSKAEEVMRMMIDKDRQLQQVYDRVKMAVAKKDEAIQKMKCQYEAVTERCCQLEELVEQQRRDYLLK